MPGLPEFSRFFPRYRLRSGARFSLLGPLLLLVFGCGRKATEEDCERIVVRMAELELAANHVSDPTQVAAQVSATKTSFRERTLKECVGRQISESAMTCIGKAKTTDEILSECLD